MKTPTIWRTNPSAEANEYTYDSAVFTYDSASQNYDGVVDNDLKDRELDPLVWDLVEKTPTAWMSDTSTLYPFDSASDTYDSPTQTYDGTVDSNRKTPTRWTNS